MVAYTFIKRCTVLKKKKKKKIFNISRVFYSSHMDFKDRFKGKTSMISKVRVIDTLASAANPVQKSQSNSQFTSYNKAVVPIPEDLPSNYTRILYS